MFLASMIDVCKNMDMLIPMLSGFLLDAIVGDPQKLPHPIRLFGRIISFFEKKYNKGSHRKLKGVAVGFFLTSAVFAVLFATERCIASYTVVYYIFNTIMFFYAISNRSLITESYRVEKYLRLNDMENARYYLSWIVGRDTDSLSEHKIRTAVLETMSENLNDGVIAPIFFYMLGGIPLMFAYKMINTLDSMIGYKNQRFLDFGWFSARILDDAANFIPSRLTALFMFLCCPKMRVIQNILRFGRCHSSPNSGFPESALSGILDCRFGGGNLYGGVLVEKPYIGNNDRTLTPKDFNKAAIINISVSLLAVCLCTVILVV